MVGRPVGSGGRAEELTQEEIKRIDKCLIGTRHEHRNRALLYLGIGSGMRVSEICNLRMKDIAPHNNILNRIVLEKHSTKSKQSRTVALNIQAVIYLKKYLATRKTPPEPNDPVFVGQKNPKKPMASSHMISIIDKMFKDAGVANASSHSLRRTHANSLRRQGADLMIIKEQLGHSSLATTQRYFQADPIEVQRAVELLRF